MRFSGLPLAAELGLYIDSNRNRYFNERMSPDSRVHDDRNLLKVRNPKFQNSKFRTRIILGLLLSIQFQTISFDEKSMLVDCSTQTSKVRHKRAPRFGYCFSFFILSSLVVVITISSIILDRMVISLKNLKIFLQSDKEHTTKVVVHVDDLKNNFTRSSQKILAIGRHTNFDMVSAGIFVMG